MAYFDKISVNGTERDIRDAGAVRFDEAQSLTDAQKAVARDNMGGASSGDVSSLTGRVTTAEGDIDALEASAVRYTEQTLSAAQQQQARENLQLAKASAIAPEYRFLNFPYSAGHYCIHEGGLYRALVDIPSAEEWTAAHWQYEEAGTVLREHTTGMAALGGRLDTVEGDIDALEASAVRYTAQALTEVQKAQARANIGVPRIYMQDGWLVIEAEEGDTYYDQWEWSSTAQGTARLTRLPYRNIPVNTGDGYHNISYADNDTQNGRSFVGLRGVAPLVSASTGEPTAYYPIPVPAGATKFTATISPAGQVLCAFLYKYDAGSGRYNLKNQSEWHTTTHEETFTASDGLWVAIACKYNTSGAAFPVEPELTIVFE